jgi:hypothetical protein
MPPTFRARGGARAHHRGLPLKPEAEGATKNRYTAPPTIAGWG